MAAVRSTLDEWGTRRIAFTFVVLAVLVFYLFVTGSWRNHAFVFTSWFELGVLPEEFLTIEHRLHELAFAVVFWPFLVGLAAQLRSPRRHVTGQLMALVTFVVLALAFAVTDFWDPVMIVVILGVPTLIATLLHPAGMDLVESIDADSANRVLLVLVVLAAIPLLAFANTQVGLQTGAIDQAGHGQDGAGHEEIHDEHIVHGHFTIMVAGALVVIGVGLLSSLQQPGWWLGAWLTGLVPIVLGIGGFLAPEAASNPGDLWNALMILWGLVFVAAAEVTQTAERPTLLGERGLVSTSE